MNKIHNKERKVKMKKKNFISSLIALLLVISMNMQVLAAPENPPVNFVKRGSITVHKLSYSGTEVVEDGTGLEDHELPTGTTPIEGAVYEIKQTHKLVQATNNQEELVELDETESNATIKRGTTGKDGSYAFTDLALGRYTLREISAPGHLVDTTEYIVDVPLTVTNGTQLLYDVHVYPKNIPVEGSVQFLKVADDGTNILEGANFHLFNADGTRVGNEVYTSDSSGRVKATGLSPGSYYFQEVSTVENYLLNNTKIEFEIEEVLDGNQPGTVDLPNFPNYLAPTVIIEQRDINETEWSDGTTTLVGDEVDFRISTPLPTDIKEYTKYELSDTIDSRFDYMPGTEKIYVISKDETTTVLEDGDYVLTKPTEENTQIKLSLTPEGIAKMNPGDALCVEFTTTVNEDAIPTAERNEKIPSTAVVTWDNNKGSASSTESESSYTTPKIGSLKITKFEKGNEAKTLEGASFKLQKKDGKNNWIDVEGSEKTTGADGKLNWQPLTSGNYRLIETKAPATYKLLANPIEFSISDGTDDNAPSHEFKVFNTPEGTLPQTGGMGTIFFTLTGSILISVAGIALLKDKKQRKLV